MLVDDASTATMATPSRRPATLADLIARSDSDRLEIVNGELVEKAAPSFAHATTELELSAAIAPFNRKPGGREPGGWWLSTEIHVSYSGHVYCHDCAGWRRERVPERPTEWPVSTRPDWVGEIVSPKHEAHDFVTKPSMLHAAEVPHYWILAPEAKLLLVHRWSRDGYVVVQRASAGHVIRAEPFDAVEISVSRLFGDDSD